MSNKPYTPKPVELHAVGKVKMHHSGYTIMNPDKPEGYSWEAVYDFNGKMVVVWWNNRQKCLADISDFERNAYGIRTKPLHSPMYVKDNYRIYGAISDYQELPEIE